MSSMCLMCWRHVIKSAHGAVDDFYVGWPPMKLFKDGHMDLEFSPFLLANTITMDSSSYDQLTTNPPVGAERAALSLKTLKKEGILQLVDYENIFSVLRPSILAQSKLKLTHPELFIDPVRDSIGLWDEVGNTYANVIGQSGDRRAQLPVGILAGVTADGSVLTDDRISLVRNVLAKRSDAISQGEKDLIREIARPYIDHVHTGVVLHQTQKVPIVDWPDMLPIYNSMFASNFEHEVVMQREIPLTRKLFSIALDRYEPSNVKEYLKIIRDKRISKLRKFVSQAAEKGVEPDPQLTKDLLENALLVEQGKSSRGTTLNAVGTTVSVLVSALGSGVPTSVAVASALAIGTLQEAVSQLRSTRSRELDWFLCLVNAKKTKKVKH
jgi:hypothetical protein